MASILDQFNRVRVRECNDKAVDGSGEYVLYWAQIYRRLTHNHALDYALGWAKKLGKPLVVYEGLRLDYPWASARHHRFLLDGMRDNARGAEKLGINYWPFVATPERDKGTIANPEQSYRITNTGGHGLLRRLSKNACLIVTDDWRCYIVPGQTAALAEKGDCAVHAVDSNSIVPMALLGDATKTAASLRTRIHKNFAEAWRHRCPAEPEFPKRVSGRVDPPFPVWDHTVDLDGFVAGLPIDQSVPAVPAAQGGSAAALGTLETFLDKKLDRYADERNQPDDPGTVATSRLSPYLRAGHIAAEHVIDRVLSRAGGWSVDQLDDKSRGKRDGFFGGDSNLNGFIDEAVTWRDVGQQWHWHRHKDTASLQKALPGWAMATLNEHRGDPREYVYTHEQFEAGDTHDDLWNAAQRELVATGTIHNYMRMLWGKKVLEWSKTPEGAYATLEELNNKYAIDGRDPNSYSGILWCFGLFDRAWGPEREVYGTVRYMSSENTGRKFKLKGYWEYIESLPTIAQVRAGEVTRKKQQSLFG